MENEEQTQTMELSIARGKATVKLLGGSYYLLIDRYSKNRLDIRDGMILGYKLWNIPIIKITCPACKYEFEDETDQDPHDCPSCGEEFTNIDILESGDKL